MYVLVRDKMCVLNFYGYALRTRGQCVCVCIGKCVRVYLTVIRTWAPGCPVRAQHKTNICCPLTPHTLHHYNRVLTDALTDVAAAVAFFFACQRAVIFTQEWDETQWAGVSARARLYS